MRLRYLLVLTVCAGLAAACQGLPHGPVPAPRVGSGTHDIAPADWSRRWLDGVGVMRTFCEFSHASHDDPIVAPGQPGATHLHNFFGNTSIDAFTTDPANTGGSTCTGGTANRSAYWVPAMLDGGHTDPTTGYASVVDTYNDFGQHTGWQDTFNVGGNLALNVYYKTGYRGVPSDDVVIPPPGLRMIAGSGPILTMEPTGPGDPTHVAYNCVEPRFGGESLFTSFDHIPTEAEDPDCTIGNLMMMIVIFPQCWDGVNLDSANHRSHMAYSLEHGAPGCPSSHPVAIPEISYHVRYGITEANYPTANWRLASDTYPIDRPGGWSGHADWWNGWDQPIFERIRQHCYQGGWDCIGELLGPNPTTGVLEKLN